MLGSEKEIINELKKNNECDILSFIAVPLSEENKEQIKKFNNANDKYFYKNGNVLKNIIDYRKELKKVINNYDAVICYNVAYPWLKLPKINKRKKSILILADFSDTNSFKNIILKLYAKICKNDIRRYEYVVGLSEKTKYFLKKKSKVYLYSWWYRFRRLSKCKAYKERWQVKNNVLW